MKLYVIAWRPRGGKPFFFRGDRRYEVYLPFISEGYVSDGWKEDIAHARLFEAFPVFDSRSFSKRLDATRIRIFPYDGEVLETQVIRPIRRPQKKYIK